MREDGKGAGTDETLVAPSDRTVGATEASQRPVSREPREAHGGDGPDYGDLVQVDPAHYSLGPELARGGMGRIVRARDRRLGRRVAIKQLLHTDPDALARFEREARITARLEHPSIVAVHEAGRWPSGEPFYAMKLIAGRPLDKCIADAPGLAERLALLGNVTAAVNALAYAHSERVIHRDLKPANLLIGDYGETVVIDWGLAKDLATQDSDGSSLPPRSDSSGGETIAGAVIGTPAYMPPEQAAGESVDERADVYALGALLYHLLAGVPPYVARTVDDVLALVQAGPPPPIGEREPDAPADLIAIVDKAMARDRTDRFATAKEMASELERFQMGQLVRSRRYTRWELVWRWVRRYRAAVTVGAIALAALVVLATAGLIEIFAERARANERTAEARARADDAALVRAHDLLETDPSRALAALRDIHAGSPNWRAARVIAADAVERGVADVLYAGQTIHGLAVSPDGAHVAAFASHAGMGAVRDRRIYLWDLRTWTAHTVPAGDHQLASAAFAPDGQLVTADYDGGIARVDPVAGTRRPLCEVADEYSWVAVQPGGHRVALFPGFGKPAVVVELPGCTPRSLGMYDTGGWSSDGATLAVYSRGEGTVDRWDAATGAIVPIGGKTYAMAVVTDGRRAWVGNMFGAFEVTREMEPPPRADGPLDTVTGLAVLHDGRLATIFSHEQLSNNDDTRDVEEGTHAVLVRDGAVRTPLVGHETDIQRIVVAPDDRIVTGDHAGVVRVWRLPRIEHRTGEVTTTVGAATLTGDRRELVVTKRGPALEVHDVETGKIRRIAITDRPPGFEDRAERSFSITELSNRRISETTQGAGDHVIELVRSRAGRRLVSVDHIQHAVVWDLDGSRGRVLPIENVRHVAISADGKVVATVRADRPSGASRYTVERWPVTGGEPARVVEFTHSVSALALSPDGSRLAIAAIGGSDGALFIADGTRLQPLAAPRGAVSPLVFSRDGALLVGGGEHWEIYLWNLATQGVRQLRGHSGTIVTVALSPDESQLATAAGDKTVRVWKLADGSSQVLRGHTALVRSLDWSPDGEFLLTGSEDGTARLWDLVSAQNRPLTGHHEKVMFAGFSADAHRLLVVDQLDTVTTHHDDLPRDELGLRAWLATVAHDVAGR